MGRIKWLGYLLTFLVNFNVLLDKTEIFGIRGVSLQLIWSHITVREQCLKISDEDGNSGIYNHTKLREESHKDSSLLFVIYLSFLLNINTAVVLFVDATSTVCTFYEHHHGKNWNCCFYYIQQQYKVYSKLQQCWNSFLKTVN